MQTEAWSEIYYKTKPENLLSSNSIPYTFLTYLLRNPYLGHYVSSNIVLLPKDIIWIMKCQNLELDQNFSTITS